MSKRKTIEVSVIKNMVNEVLAYEDSAGRDHRRGMMRLLESILMRTENYRGFRYLKQHEVPANVLPGIRPENGLIGTPENFENTDNTRVSYI